LKALNIAIVGAGPAGLASALYMARAGHKPVIFERFESVAPVGSGLMLQPTGLTVLDDLGLLRAMMARGHRIDRLVGSDAKSGRTVLDVTYQNERNGRFGLAVNRAALFDVLYKAVVAQRIEIVTGCAIEGIDANSALIDARGRGIGRFDLIVDTSGARSKLRQFARVPAEPKPLPYGALWAMLEWHGQQFEAHALTQRYDKASVMIGVLPSGTLCEGGAEKAAFFWSIKPQDFAVVEARGVESWKERVLGYWPECAVYLDQISSFEDMTLAHYGHHTLQVPAGNGIAFVGDCAHSTSPQLGQGANMALLDARALFHAMSTSESVPDALETYAKSRRWHMRVFQTLSLAFTPFYQSDSAALAFVRDKLVSSLAKIPPAPRLLAAMVAGTMIDPFKPIGLSEVDWAKRGGTHD
jgi:2-polyprenyl-6-methoxyphenol hydroxylase-like FAD-dependent oxidoreductase